MSKNPKKRWKPMKIVNIVRKSLHIFWTTWRISIKFLGKMWFMIILKVTKKPGFHTLLLEINFGKTTGVSNWHPPPPPFFPVFLELMESILWRVSPFKGIICELVGGLNIIVEK